MSALIVNAKPLPDGQMVIVEVDRWLTDEAAQGPSDSQAVFDQKWSAVTDDDYRILKTLNEEGGQKVKQVSIRKRLIKDGLKSDDAFNILRTRLIFMSQQNLVTVHHNTYDGDEISFHPAWQWHIKHRLGTSASIRDVPKG